MVPIQMAVKYAAYLRCEVMPQFAELDPIIEDFDDAITFKFFKSLQFCCKVLFELNFVCCFNRSKINGEIRSDQLDYFATQPALGVKLVASINREFTSI